MSGDAFFDFFGLHSNVHIHLLEGPDRVVAVVLEVLDRTHHPGLGREHVETRVLATFGWGDIANLEVQGNVIDGFCLPHPKVFCKLLTYRRGRPPDDAAI